VGPGPVPPGDADRHLDLFATFRYHALKLEDHERYVRLDHHDGDRLVGSLCGIEHATPGGGLRFASGMRAPFGGVDLVRDREPVDSVFGFVGGALDELARRGVTSVLVKAKPASYSGSEVMVQHSLLAHGFTVASSELSYAFDLSAWPTHADYVAALKPPARRALRHLADGPWTYGEARTDAEWAEAYEVIRVNRAAKQRPLQLPLEYVLRLRDVHAGRIRFFVLRHDGAPVASALLYRLEPGIELVEYWGDAHDLPRSPMNLLASKVVEGAIAEGLRIVDLGLSSVQGLPDPGLIQFKQSVGARAELRLDLVRPL
jgi:hypothetical protein